MPLVEGVVQKEVIKESLYEAAAGMEGPGGNDQVLPSAVPGGKQGANIPKMDEVLSAASIPEVLFSPTLASLRLVHSLDEHILERVELRMAKRNLDCIEDNFQGAYWTRCWLQLSKEERCL